MKLVRYLEGGQPRAGIMDTSGVLRSLSPLVADWTVAHLTDNWRRVLDAVAIDRLPRVDGDPALLPPLGDIRQILGIGLNYRDHAAEAGLDVPSAPMVFMKSIGSLAGAGSGIIRAAHADALDWEVELGVVIRHEARHLSAVQASEAIGGYLVAMDVSEREWQLNRGGQFGKGKSYNSFTPVGPLLVTPDEVMDPQALALRLSVNGVTRQQATTAEMVFGVQEIVAHLSCYQTLLPGDLILTGTPAGVGSGTRPPLYLQLGDEVVCEIDGLGRQHHRVVAEDDVT